MQINYFKDTQILGVNLSAFIYRLHYEDFSSIIGTNPVHRHYCLFQWLRRNLHEKSIHELLKSLCIKLSTEHSTSTPLNYTLSWLTFCNASKYENCKQSFLRTGSNDKNEQEGTNVGKITFNHTYLCKYCMSVFYNGIHQVIAQTCTHHLIGHRYLQCVPRPPERGK